MQRKGLKNITWAKAGRKIRQLALASALSAMSLGSIAASDQAHATETPQLHASPATQSQLGPRLIKDLAPRSGVPHLLVLGKDDFTDLGTSTGEMLEYVASVLQSYDLPEDTFDRQAVMALAQAILMDTDVAWAVPNADGTGNKACFIYLPSLRKDRDLTLSRDAGILPSLIELAPTDRHIDKIFHAVHEAGHCSQKIMTLKQEQELGDLGRSYRVWGETDADQSLINYLHDRRDEDPDKFDQAINWRMGLRAIINVLRADLYSHVSAAGLTADGKERRPHPNDDKIFYGDLEQAETFKFAVDNVQTAVFAELADMQGLDWQKVPPRQLMFVMGDSVTDWPLYHQNPEIRKEMDDLLNGPYIGPEDLEHFARLPGVSEFFQSRLGIDHLWFFDEDGRPVNDKQFLSSGDLLNVNHAVLRVLDKQTFAKDSHEYRLLNMYIKGMQDLAPTVLHMAQRDHEVTKASQHHTKKKPRRPTPS